MYEKTVDRESAYERLKGKALQAAATGSNPTQAPADKPWVSESTFPGPSHQLEGGGRRGDTVVDAMMKNAARSIGSSVGRQIIRGVLGSLLGGRSR